jgi:hypothetical protein
MAGLLEMTVPRIVGVDPAWLTSRNQLDGDGLCHAGSLVSDDVHVVATRIDKSHAHCVDMRRALGVMAFIGSYGACSDDDQAMAGMRVPACLSSRLPDIALHVQI